MGGQSSKRIDFSTAEATKRLCKEAIRGCESVHDGEEALKAAFKMWDADGNGVITCEELAAVFESLSVSISMQQIKQVMKDMDWNGDGGIDFNELTTWLCMAPNLTKFFALAEEMCSCASEDVKVAQSMGDVIKRHSRLCEEMQKRLTPIINRAFDFHDKSNTGVLDTDESVIFFANYLARLIPFVEAVGIYSLTLDVAEDQWALDAAEFTTKLKERTQVLVAEYHKNPDSRIRAAFACVDANGDGRLQRREVFEAMVFGSMRNQEFLAALRMMASRAEIQALIDELSPARPPPMPAGVKVDKAAAAASVEAIRTALGGKCQ